MIVGLTGYAGVGKDAAAGQLVERYGFERRAFADALKAVAYDANPYAVTRMAQAGRLAGFIDDRGWESVKRDPYVRRFLQDLGVACREHLGEHVWIGAVQRTMSLDGFHSYVLADCRFDNEAQWIHDLGGVVIRIERPGVGPVNGHVSEVPVLSHHTVVNDGTPKELGDKIMTIIKGD